MNEKNKNEQTFSDLFSNIKMDKDNSINSQDKNNSISFNNLTNDQVPLTMNDIFENKVSEEKKVSFSDLNVKNISSKSNIFDDVDKEKKSLNNIFDNINEKESSKSNEFDKSNKDDLINNSNKQDFFAPSNSLDNLTESAEEVVKPNLNLFMSEEEKSNKVDEVQEENIFFTKKDENLELPKEESVSFFGEEFNGEHPNQELDLKKEDNLGKSDEVQEENIFFSEKDENLELPKEESVSFFGEEFNGEHSNQELDLKKEDNLSKVDEVQEENPFFENTSTLEKSSNPFFDNNINLVENHQLESKNKTIDTSAVKHFDVKIVNKKEPLLKFILGVLSYSIFILLLLIGITLLVYVADIKIREAKGDTSLPTYNAYVVLTGSMLPEIQVYDVVITKKVEPKDLNEGDVITFASSDSRFLNTIITHRIIKKIPPSGNSKNYTFQTKGDNNNVADSALVQSNNIYGKVIFKIPKLGYLQEFLATDGGWILVILLPCLAVVSYDIVNLSKRIKKNKKLKVQK
jgi:signal peptidase